MLISECIDALADPSVARGPVGEAVLGPLAVLDGQRVGGPQVLHLASQVSAVSSQLSTVRCQQSAVSSQVLAVSCQQLGVNSQVSAVSTRYLVSVNDPLN